MMLAVEFSDIDFIMLQFVGSGLIMRVLEVFFLVLS